MNQIHTIAEDSIRLIRADHERLKYEVDQLRVLLNRRPAEDLPLYVASVTETLLPGENATATIQRWSGMNDEYADRQGSSITIYDPLKFNFGISGDLFRVYRTAHGRFEIVGSSGITNVKAKVKTGSSIASGGSGTAVIWAGNSSTGIEVTAHLNWIYDDTLAADTALKIDWDRWEEKWLVTDNDC